MTCWPPRSYFNPRSSCEERPRERFACRIRRDFNPRSSCEERRASLSDGRHADAISIHAPHARSDTPKDVPCGRFDVISIHAPHARSDLTTIFPGFVLVLISIHAPHARSDLFILLTKRVYIIISIHAPHARSDQLYTQKIRYLAIFQSTLLMRGATNSHSSGRIMSRYFNPRSSCEERLLHAPSLPFMHHFNPRSSCEERRDFG